MIWIQLIGFFAAALGIFSFQMKTRMGILLMQGAASTLWVLQFFLLGNALAGAVLNILFAVRGFLFAFKDRFGKTGKRLLPALFCLFLLAAGAALYKSPLDLLPVLGGIASTVAAAQTDEQKVRAFSLLSSPCWLVYDAAVFSLAGVLTECFSLVSIGVALFRCRRKKDG